MRAGGGCRRPRAYSAICGGVSMPKSRSRFSLLGEQPPREPALNEICHSRREEWNRAAAFLIQLIQRAPALVLARRADAQAPPRMIEPTIILAKRSPRPHFGQTKPAGRNFYALGARPCVALRALVEGHLRRTRWDGLSLRLSLPLPCWRRPRPRLRHGFALQLGSVPADARAATTSSTPNSSRCGAASATARCRSAPSCGAGPAADDLPNDPSRAARPGRIISRKRPRLRL